MSLHRFMAVLAAFPVVLAVFVGEIPHYDRVIDNGQMDVIQLARKLRDREPLVLLDLRSAPAIREHALPGAMSMDEAEGQIRPGTDIVIVGYERSADWIPLHEQGFTLHFVADAINQWTQTIEQPRLYRGSSQQERAHFEEISSLSRYFGGAPRIVDRPVDELPRVRPRRGCGF